MKIMERYLSAIHFHLAEIQTTQETQLSEAAKLVADRIEKDELVFVYGPGGHSNLGSQEVFFRAGGLMHINAILDEGTLLSNGALRSMEVERTPGYGREVMEKTSLGNGDVLVLVNAYGINAALIDAAIYCKEVGASLIAVTSVRHAISTSLEHPARHPTQKNLADFADVVLDCGIEPGDSVLAIEGVEQKVGAMSTFANSFLMQCLVMRAVELLAEKGVEPPIWRSGNVEGGDEWNSQFIDRFRDRIQSL